MQPFSPFLLAGLAGAEAGCSAATPTNFAVKEVVTGAYWNAETKRSSGKAPEESATEVGWSVRMKKSFG